VNGQTEKLSIAGPVGPLQVLQDLPSNRSKGVAVICHPHPLFGGTMDNKVVQTLARAAVASDYVAVRFNFRGIGESAGEYDKGVGETDDLAAVLEHFAQDGPIVLAGFSFGSYVCTRWLARADSAHLGRLQRIVLVGVAATRFDVPPIAADLHIKTSVIHGEDDDTVPLADALAWARPQLLPVTVVPGVGHFFHGQLPLLKNWAVQQLR
jgi:alpha/beta superfamily hydrolase